MSGRTSAARRSWRSVDFELAIRVDDEEAYDEYLEPEKDEERMKCAMTV